MNSEYPVKDLCLVLRVPRSSYYAWQLRQPSRRTHDNQRLRQTLSALFLAHRKVYGSPRLTVCLQRLGIPCSRNRVARHMRALQIKARQKRAFKPKTTDSNHPHPIARNLLANHIPIDRVFYQFPLKETLVLLKESPRPRPLRLLQIGSRRLIEVSCQDIRGDS